MVTFAKAPIRRLFKEAGAERVSDEAVDALHDFIIEEATAVANNSVNLASFNNRKTVQGRDIDAVLSFE